MSTQRIDYRVALALAPGEAKRITRSAAFLLFLPLSVWALMTATQGHQQWSQASIAAALGLVPLGWCMIALTNLATLRDHRHGVDTIADTTPATHAARTGGHLLGGLVGVPIGVALLLVWYVVSDIVNDPAGSPDLLELAVPLLIVAGAAVVGVAVGRWLPWALFSVPAIIATLVITGLFSTSRTSRSRFLGFRVEETSTGLPGLDPRPSALHVIWMLAWIGLVTLVALARHNRGPRMWGAATLLGAVAIASGVSQVSAIDGETASERADLLNSATQHQDCETVDGVRYCSYPDSAEHVGLWKDTTAAVLALLPASVDHDELVIVQRVPWISGNSSCGPSKTLDLLETPIRDRVSVNNAWRADGHVHPGLAAEGGPCSEGGYVGLYTAVQVGAWSVGLPPAQWGRGETCGADGQARAVIALWLGAAVGGKLASYIEDVSVGDDGRVDFSDWDDQPTWGVDWHPSDLDAAVVLSGLPPSAVHQVVSRHWIELIDPTTPTARLLQLLDRPPPTTIDAPLDTCLGLEP